jgi:hypothetical protein
MEDVKAWTQLKKDELELQKLLVKADESDFKTEMFKKATDIVLKEVAIEIGQFTFGAFIKKLFRGFFTPKNSGKSHS